MSIKLLDLSHYVLRPSNGKISTEINKLIGCPTASAGKHPNVRYDAYHEQRDAIFYVMCEDMQLHPKEHTILLSTGAFVLKEACYVINWRSSIYSENADGAERFKKEWQVAVDSGKIPVLHYSDGYHLDLRELEIEEALRVEDFKRFVADASPHGHQNHRVFSNAEREELMEMFTETEFSSKQIFIKLANTVLSQRKQVILKPKNMESQYPGIDIPQDSELLPGIRLAFSSNSQLARVIKHVEYDKSHPHMKVKPILILHNGVPNSEAVIYSNHAVVPDVDLRMVQRDLEQQANRRRLSIGSQNEFVFENFPLDLALMPSAGNDATESVPTDNNYGGLLNYSAKVNRYKKCFLMTEEEEKIAKNSKRDPVFMGIELEYVAKITRTQTHGNVVQAIAQSKMGDHCIMKSDSSIRGGEGLELVTIPATLAYHKKMFDEHFYGPNQHNTKVLANNTCGLHVHISKEAFVEQGPRRGHRKGKRKMSSLALGKFIYFFNNPHNAEFIYNLSGRRPNMYCEHNSVKATARNGVARGVTAGKAVSRREGSNHWPRRSIINCENAATIEIRLFKSTTTRNRLFRRLEFCHALVEFCKVAAINELTVHHFINFVIDSRNLKLYPCLARWLTAKKYVESHTKRSKITKKLYRVYTKNNVEPPKYTSVTNP